VTISVEDAELRQRILAGRFLTTIYDIDLEGKKHRVIPRDFHLDPVRDFPIHVDFMRLGEAPPSASAYPCTSRTRKPHRASSAAVPSTSSPIRSSWNARSTHPEYIEADVSSLEISHSLHLSDVKLPKGVRSLSREDATLVTIVPPSGYAEEIKAAAAAAAGGGAAAAAPGAAAAAGAAAPAGVAPAAGAKAPALVPRLLRPAPRRPRRAPSLPAATRRSKPARDAASCVCSSTRQSRREIRA